MEMEKAVSFIECPSLRETEEFFGAPLPDMLQKALLPLKIYQKINQTEIMKAIDFTPPFLRIEKMIIMGDERDLTAMRSIGMGRIYAKDIEGYYKHTICLGMCGWLMASSASIYLAVLFPQTAPQVAAK